MSDAGPQERWRSLRSSTPDNLIWLVLSDVDGVITPGEGSMVDLEVLRRLAVYNQACLEDPAVPALTLCTGRPAPYVEMLAQMLDVFLPCIFEHGAGLVYPREFRYAFHPALGPSYVANVAALRAALDEPLLRPARGFVQPGKEASLTLYPLGSTSLEELGRIAREVVEEQGGLFTVAANVHGVEIRPNGVDKGTALTWLADQVQVPLDRMAGVGDSETDVTFLEQVRYAAAPANATPGVRAVARYVSPEPYGDGLLDVLQRVEEMNRARLRG
jgi:HAD superfamily hydrolase (TIGR01484 family)